MTTFGSRLIQSAREAVAIAKGEADPAAWDRAKLEMGRRSRDLPGARPGGAGRRGHPQGAWPDPGGVCGALQVSDRHLARSGTGPGSAGCLDARLPHSHQP